MCKLHSCVLQYYEVEMLPVLLRLVGLALAQYKGSQKGDVEDLVNHRCCSKASLPLQHACMCGDIPRRAPTHGAAAALSAG